MATISCKECVFAVYDSKTQTECSLGRIEKYRKRKVGKVIEAYDNDKEFFILENIQCNAHRVPEWSKTHQRHEIFAEMRTGVLIYVYMTAKSTYEQLVKTLKSIQTQSYNKYKLVVRSQTSDKLQIPKYLKDHITSDNVVVDYNLDLEQTFGEELNNSVERHSEQYYVVLNAGYVMPPGFLHNFDCMINQDVKPIGMIKPMDSKMNLLVCNTKLHKTVCGFGKDVGLIEKIEAFIPDSLKQEMILEHK